MKFCSGDEEIKSLNAEIAENGRGVCGEDAVE
jgi:hypothetical protein